MAKVLSIEISNSLIRICEMDYKKKNPRVYRHAVVPTPMGAINDGYIMNQAELKEAITGALVANKMKGTKDVIFTIASGKIITREVMLPGVKQASLGALIKTNLNEYFPIDLSSYEIAHLVLEQMKEGEHAGKYRTQIMAAETSMVKSYDELATFCGLRLVSLDYAGNSIFQAIKNEDTASRVMVLKIEESQTLISIVKEKNLMLQRSIGYGVDAAIEEVTKQPIFGADNSDEAGDLLKQRTCIKFNVSETAQRNSMDRDLSTDLETRDFDENQEIREAKIEVTKSLDTLISSIRRIIEFYASRNNGEEVDKILVTGFGGAMSGLAKLLTNELGIKTQVLNRMEGVGYLMTNQSEGIFNFVSCIGATFNPVGFISKDKKSKEKKETDFTLTTVLMLIAAVIACVALSLISIMNYNKQKDIEEELIKMEALYKKSEETYVKYTNMLNMYQQVEAGDKLTLHTNDNILKFLEELEMTLPVGAEISTFSSNDTQVVMDIKVNTEEEAALFISKMREFKSLMSVSVSAISVTELTEDEIKTLEEERTDDEKEISPTSATFTLTGIYYPNGMAPVEEE